MDIEEPKEVMAEATEINPTDTEVAAEDNLTEVEVSSLEEAVDYLVSNFDDAKKQQLRSKVNSKSLCRNKGYSFCRTLITCIAMIYKVADFSKRGANCY